MDGRPWKFLQDAVCSLQDAFLVKAFKMLSMRKTETLGGGEGKSVVPHQISSLKQCLVLPRDQQFDITFLLLGTLLPPLPSPR